MIGDQIVLVVWIWHKLGVHPDSYFISPERNLRERKLDGELLRLYSDQVEMVGGGLCILERENNGFKIQILGIN